MRRNLTRAVCWPEIERLLIERLMEQKGRLSSNEGCYVGFHFMNDEHRGDHSMFQSQIIHFIWTLTRGLGKMAMPRRYAA
uniref:Uncharacterized protein n=1 Tax=Nelumbo nucifera TaxID=4432 RepID=A0A822ZHX7_NELNU|nr:TPA_asm: hypothetical protein HUJ06_003944 [Nelumbo nucifera]